jgi:hypothetical protein
VLEVKVPSKLQAAAEAEAARRHMTLDGFVGQIVHDYLVEAGARRKPGHHGGCCLCRLTPGGKLLCCQCGELVERRAIGV